MGPETVTIEIGGNVWTAFEEIEWTAALDEAARTFRFSIAASLGNAQTAWMFRPAGGVLRIRANNDLAITGYVDRYQPKLSEHSERIIEVSGRGKAQDFIDCAAIHPTGRFENQTILQIAQALDKFGVGISSTEKLDPVDEHQITPGETAFRAVRKLVDDGDGLTMCGQADGSIRLMRMGKTLHAGALREGVNFKGASADLNWSQRHSIVLVRAQKADGSGKGNLQIEAQASDKAVGRYRPIVIVADQDDDASDAQEKANNHLKREAGEALKASGTVQGFRDDAGALWEPGNLVWIESDFLGLRGAMGIEKVVCKQSRSGGSVASLELVDPRAYGGTAAKGSQDVPDAQGAWNVGFVAGAVSNA
jgi:prophage tail gpP-like protein